MDWTRQEAREHAGRAGGPERIEQALVKYRATDRAVRAELETFERVLAEA